MYILQFHTAWHLNYKLNGKKTPAKHRDIFRDTLFAKNGEGEDRTHDLLAGKHENNWAPARVWTHDLLGGKAISDVRWSGDKVEFWQNL